MKTVFFLLSNLLLPAATPAQAVPPVPRQPVAQPPSGDVYRQPWIAPMPALPSRVISCDFIPLIQGDAPVDDFTTRVAGNVRRIRWWGTLPLGAAADPGTYSITIFNSLGCKPAMVLYDTCVTPEVQLVNVDCFGQWVYRFTATIAGPPVAAGQRYWLQICESDTDSATYGVDDFRWSTRVAAGRLSRGPEGRQRHPHLSDHRPLLRIRGGHELRGLDQVVKALTGVPHGAECPAAPSRRSPVDMEYRHLGRSGLEVSALSFGSWVTFDNQLAVEQATDCMTLAYERGVNFFDNAEAYAAGESERIMGQALKKLGWSRDSYLVSSKVFWGGKKPTQRRLHRKHVFEAAHAALERLQLDHLDLYFCHRPDPRTPIEETVRAMDQLIQQGKVLYWGTSEWSAVQIMEAHAVAAAHHLTPPTMEQPQYNMLTRDRVEAEYRHLYRSVGLGTTIWSPLASGILTNKYAEGIPSGSRLDPPGLRVAPGQTHRRGRPAQDREGPRGRRDRRRPRDLAGQAGAGLVPEEPPGQHRHPRRLPPGAAGGEPRRTGGAADADRRGDGADRVGPGQPPARRGRVLGSLPVRFRDYGIRTSSPAVRETPWGAWGSEYRPWK